MGETTEQMCSILGGFFLGAVSLVAGVLGLIYGIPEDSHGVQPPRFLAMVGLVAGIGMILLWAGVARSGLFVSTRGLKVKRLFATRVIDWAEVRTFEIAPPIGRRRTAETVMIVTASNSVEIPVQRMAASYLKDYRWYRNGYRDRAALQSLCTHLQGLSRPPGRTAISDR